MTFTQSSILTGTIFAYFFIENRGQYLSSDYMLVQTNQNVSSLLNSSKTFLTFVIRNRKSCVQISANNHYVMKRKFTCVATSIPILCLYISGFHFEHHIVLNRCVTVLFQLTELERFETFSFMRTANVDQFI